EQWMASFSGMLAAGSLEDFASAVMTQGTSYNLHYADDQGHIGYWHVSNMPVRPAGVDRRLPLDGRGGAEWRGLLPLREIPHAVDLPRGWLVNWNNQPAAGWEREYGWRARHGSLALFAAWEDPLRPAPFGGRVDADGRGWDAGDLERGLRTAAYGDSRWFALRDVLPRAAHVRTPEAKAALELLADYHGSRTPASVAQYVMEEWTDRLNDTVFADDLGEDLWWSRAESGVWLVLSPNSPAALQYDWLNGARTRDVIIGVFEATIAAIVEQHGPDPADWPVRGTGVTTYQQVSSELVTAMYREGLCLIMDSLGEFCPDSLRRSADSGIPGDVRDHHAMNRGNYNHIISYTDPPSSSGVLGESRAESCSINTPGNSGSITIGGGESPHFDDQLEMYSRWQWKSLPLGRDEVDAARAGGLCRFASATSGDGLEPEQEGTAPTDPASAAVQQPAREAATQATGAPEAATPATGGGALTWALSVVAFVLATALRRRVREAAT
ncbi:MAG TPA: penicillin acylase family protein, partial [Nitriliruptorales bacterium]